MSKHQKQSIDLPPLEELLDLFTYEPETGTLRNKIDRSYLAKAGSEAGTTDKKGYRHLQIRGKDYKVHRIVWKMVHGSISSDLSVDHINGNRSDNRIKNLRLVNHCENMRNRPIYDNNKSGVTGVSWRKDRCKWQAYIVFGGKQIHLGAFAEKSEAIAARMAAEARYGFHPNHGRAKA